MTTSRRSATESLSVGEQFARALAGRERDALIGLLAEPVDFEGLTPGRHWKATSGEQVVDEYVLGRWFGPGDDIVRLEAVETSSVAGRGHVAYRLRVCRDGTEHLVEQQVYYDAEAGRITYLRLLCSGYQPVSSPTSP
jgi:hypothetical protein